MEQTHCMSSKQLLLELANGELQQYNIMQVGRTCPFLDKQQGSCCIYLSLAAVQQYPTVSSRLLGAKL